MSRSVGSAGAGSSPGFQSTPWHRTKWRVCEQESWCRSLAPKRTDPGTGMGRQQGLLVQLCSAPMARAPLEAHMAHSTDPCAFYLVHAPTGQVLRLASQPAAASHLRGNRKRSQPSSTIPALLSDSFALKYLPIPRQGSGGLLEHRNKPTLWTAAGSSHSHDTWSGTMCAPMEPSLWLWRVCLQDPFRTHLLGPWARGPAQRLPSVLGLALLPAWVAASEGERRSRASHPAERETRPQGSLSTQAQDPQLGELELAMLSSALHSSCTV